MCRRRLRVASIVLLQLAVAGAAHGQLPMTDTLYFGNDTSEQAHGLTADYSDTIKGGLGEPARRLLPRDAKEWRGGTARFTLKLDPAKQNYVTVRLWGSDVSAEQLILNVDGKQIGYRHLGDIDVLDFGSREAGYPGRFYYRTTPLPISLTKGKTQATFEIRSTGRIWGHGQNFEEYQKPMTGPTRGIYAAYTHTDGCFTPPANEKQGAAPANLPVRTSPGAEVLDQLKHRVNGEITRLLADERAPNHVQMQFLARAYHVKWSAAYKNSAVLDKLVQTVDDVYTGHKRDEKLPISGADVYNPDWVGLGLVGDAVQLLGAPLQVRLAEPLADGTSRSDGWARVFSQSRDWHRAHRRQYTNQSMINDLYGIYLSNRAIAAIAPDKALPEDNARRYLYESVGLAPWLGDDGENGPKRPLGDNYLQLTAKGLTKELGYVGNYGEVLDWMTHIYNATRPTPDAPGDEKLKGQLIKAEHARAAFRYPMPDAEGNRAMRMETIVGWRDMVYPGEVTYGERSAWEGSAIYSIAAGLDPRSIGAAHQMFEDNQFFNAVSGLVKDKSERVLQTILRIPDDYERAKAQPDTGQRLPMTPGQPDFVFSDEEAGVVAIKNGEEILYASLYWRARYGINGLARVHYITPQFDRIAVVHEGTTFEPSGQKYARRDWTNFGFGNGGIKYNDGSTSAHAGEELPIAKIPQGVRFNIGDESPYAGKGDFYTLRYGRYLIGMNTTTDKTFTLTTPEGATSAAALPEKRAVHLKQPVRVSPRSTSVLYIRQ